jgi:hypothetical protein
MHTNYSIGDEVKLSLSAAKRVISKVLPLTSSVPIILEIPGGLQLQMYRHTFQNRTLMILFLDYNCTVGGCPPNNIDNTCTWSATMAMIYPSVYPTMMKVINKALPSVSAEPNVIESRSYKYIDKPSNIGPEVTS